MNDVEPEHTLAKQIWLNSGHRLTGTLRSMMLELGIHYWGLEENTSGRMVVLG